MYKDQLGTVKEARDECVIGKPAAYYQAVVMKSRGILRKESLSGGINALTEDAPLSAVGVAREREVDVELLYIARIVFGVVVEKHLVAFFLCKAFKPFKIRCGSMPVVAFVDALVVNYPARGKSSDLKTFKFGKSIFKQSYTAVAANGTYLFDCIALVVAERHEGRCGLRELGKHFKASIRRIGVLIDYIAGHEDQIGFFVFDLLDDLLVWAVMRVGNECRA